MLGAQRNQIAREKKIHARKEDSNQKRVKKKNNLNADRDTHTKNYLKIPIHLQPFFEY